MHNKTLVEEDFVKQTSESIEEKGTAVVNQSKEKAAKSEIEVSALCGTRLLSLREFVERASVWCYVG